MTPTERLEVPTLFDQPAPSPISTAVVTIDGLYRYRLLRSWQPSKPMMVWVMLNPSTADARADDATIRRCKGYAKQEGCGGIIVVNLYAYRATSPAVMLAAADRVGPDNDDWLQVELVNAHRHGWPVVCGWGGNAEPHRVAAFRRIADMCEARLLCIGVTKDGAPRHPSRGSYVPLTPWLTGSVGVSDKEAGNE
jgi:hypothetical protein